MTKPKVILAAATAVLAASPLAARPMTATDMHSMHRLGAPEVSRDGRYAVFTVSTTDWEKNKRVNTLHLLDLSRPGATPQPVAGAEKGHDAVFGSDGALWFLMPAGDSDQLFRMAIGGKPAQVSSFKGDVGGFRLAPSGDRVVVWADRDFRCGDLNCASLPEKPKTGSGRTYDQLFVRHWDTWAEPGVRSRLFGYSVAGGKLAGNGVTLTGALVGDAPSKPFGGAEEVAFSPDGRTVFFTLREAGRIEAKSTNLDVFQVPSDGSAPPINLTDANDATDNLPAVSPDGRTLAYTGLRGKQAGIWRSGIDGSSPTLLAPVGASHLGFTPDGRSLYFTATIDGDAATYLLPIDGGTPRRVGGLLLSRAGMSPDGSMLAGIFRRDPRAGQQLGVIATATSQVVQTFDNVTFATGGGPVAWDHRGDALLYTTGERMNLWRQPLAGGTPVKVTNFSDKVIVRFALSPDGKSLALSRGVTQRDAFVVSNFR